MTSIKASIKHEVPKEPTETRAKLFHGHLDWQMIRLRQLIGDGSKLADNHLSAQLADYYAKAAAHVRERQTIFREHNTRKARLQHLRTMKHKLPVMPPVLAAWRELSAQFERAVLDGDAD